VEVYRSVNGFVWSCGGMGADRSAYISADVWIYFKPTMIFLPVCSRGRFFNLVWIAVNMGLLALFLRVLYIMSILLESRG
jgi:hypothetical protein